MTLLGFKTILHKKKCRSGKNSEGPAENSWVLDLCNFLSVLHPNLVSSPIKGILKIFNLTPRCIPMDILAWTDCVRSSAGKIS
jgi:hypothetical protein